MSKQSPATPPPRRAILRRMFVWLYRLWPFAARVGLESALAGDAASGKRGFDANERMMLQNVLRLRARTLADVMVPRENIVGVPASASLEEVVRLFGSAPHSRLPVYRGTLDEPAGMIHIRDALAQWRENPALEDISGLMRQPLFAPPQMRVTDLLQRMQRERMHMALVVDEHGGICGLVSIEDLVEEIVGEIEDEHDPHVIPLSAANGQMEADGQTPLEDIERALGLSLPPRDEAIRSLGGLIVAHLGRVPKSGEKVKFPETGPGTGLTVEIVKADARRVHRALLRRKKHAKKQIAAKKAGKRERRAG